MSDGLRVMFVVEQYVDEGARYYRDFFKALCERGCQVSVFNFARSDRFAEDVRPFVEHVEQLGLKSRYRAGRLQLRRSVTEQSVDVVQAMETLSAYHSAVALAGRRRRPGLIYGRRHGKTLGPPHKWMDQIAAMIADRVIAVSPATAAIARREHPFLARKVCAVKSGVRVAAHPAPEPAIRSGETFTVLLLSRLRPVKGHDVALEATSLIREEMPGLRVRFVGEGPHRPAIEKRRAELGLQDIVDMPGHTDDVSAVLAEADVMIIPSYADAFPKVGVEAFAAGVPVIASNVEGLVDLVDDGRTGYLIPPGDPAALGATLSRLHSDGEQLGRMSVAAHAEYRDHYTIDVMTDAYLKIFHDVLRERACGS